MQMVMTPDEIQLQIFADRPSDILAIYRERLFPRS